MTRSTIFRATAGAWFALAASCLPVWAELKAEDLYSAVVPSIITLEVENTAGRHFVGTAFLAAGDGLAVTAWHVVHDAQHVEARYAGGERVKVAGLVDKNEQLDLALIKLGGPSRSRITLGTAAPRIGSRIYVLGSPRGFDFSISEGLLSQVRTVDGVRYYQLSCPISPGDSGGPVLNDRGEAIGVVSWRKADAENVAFAVPSDAVAAMDAARAPVTWLSVAGGAVCSSVPFNEDKPLVRSDATPPAPPSTNDYRSLQQFLSELAGQRVTVTVQGPGKKGLFKFYVPREVSQ